MGDVSRSLIKKHWKQISFFSPFSSLSSSFTSLSSTGTRKVLVTIIFAGKERGLVVRKQNKGGKDSTMRARERSR